MELVEGRIRLTFDLGSGALTLTSNRKYNTGVWYKITLQRNKRKGTTITPSNTRAAASVSTLLNVISHFSVWPGYLSIMAADQSSEKEVLEADSPGKASDLNRSDLDPIFIGGFPASRPIRWVFEDKGDYNIARTVLSPVNAISLVARRQVASRSYVGCIKNVEIARSNFDLLRDAHGVRKGCILKVSSDYTSPSYPTSTCWKSFSCSLTGHHLIVGVFSGLLQGLYIRI